MISPTGSPRVKSLLRFFPAFALAFSFAAPTSAQERMRRPPVEITDTLRARELFVSNRWEDHPDSYYERAIEGK